MAGGGAGSSGWRGWGLGRVASRSRLARLGRHSLHCSCNIAADTSVRGASYIQHNGRFGSARHRCSAVDPAPVHGEARSCAHRMDERRRSILCAVLSQGARAQLCMSHKRASSSCSSELVVLERAHERPQAYTATCTVNQGLSLITRGSVGTFFGTSRWPETSFVL